jgi:hypothetical protein
MTRYQLKFYKKGYAAGVKVREARSRSANIGRPRDRRKAALAEAYGIGEYRLNKISQRFLDQLDRCKDDDARRVLLEVTA